MIVTISDFLQTLIKKEKEIIKEYEIIKHGPTIGDMYEGLTAHFLDIAMFKGLDIRIEAGKIKNVDGEFSNEIDCMIVEGEGEKIPYTNKYIYEYSQVIAVIEIKKTLYLNEIKDSYEKMKNIYSISDYNLESSKGLRDAFRQIVKKELPNYSDLKKLSFEEEMIYHTLLIHEIMPVRIALGYYGYKSEFALREAFFSYLTDNVQSKGFSPVVFPDLIISGDSSILKLHAMPYIGPIDVEGYWNFYGSTQNHPIRILLELIWTRLSYKYKISSDIFGEDLEQEVINQFLRCKAVRKGEAMGWEVRYERIEKHDLSNRPSTHEWMPEEVTDQEAVLLMMLCNYGTLKANDEPLEDYDLYNEKSLEEVIQSLQAKGLAYQDEEEIGLLTDQCQVVTARGKWYVADNKSGRFSNWLMRNL
ncbi:DUF6602 domain-containing protein [Psychrobacillus sp. FSL K6-1267]|uniref:DUF6602 domain-containing protein n=1 Tax=Psychrobacillus sp. FSL K6-1267 TaxID=2921543 RepID=UPI0030F591A9